MSHTWILSGLAGLAITVAAAVPFAHRGANTNSPTSTNANGSNGAIVQTGNMHLAPHYRVPVGSPIPDPPKLPGHLRPYSAGKGMSFGSANNGALVRR